MLKKLSNFKIYLPIFIFLLAFIWRLWGLNAQGETWDEIAYYNAGKSYLRNIKNLNFTPQDWEINREHPPLAKYIYGLVSINSYRKNIIDYTNGRIFSALMGVLTILIVYYLGKRLFSTKVAVLAALILTFLPYFVGLNKIYGLDTLMVLLFTLTVYLFILAVEKSSRFFYILSGVSLGLAIATKFNNFLLFILLPIIFFILKPKEVIFGKDKKLLWYFLSIPLVAGLILFVSWPWLWSQTYSHFAQTIGHWGEVKEIYFGKVTSPGLSYYFIYLLITTPLLVLFLLIPFFIETFKNTSKYYWVILAWFLTIFLVILSPTNQNGIRYILAIYPPLAIMASLGFFSLWKKDSAILVSTLILIFYLMFNNFIVHPYYLTYYNELVGGPYGVYKYKLFPLGWWGEGIEEAAIWLSVNAENGSKIHLNASPNHTSGGKLRKDLILTSENPDYVILNLANIWYNQAKVDEEKFTLVHRIKAAGVPIVEIYQRKK